MNCPRFTLPQSGDFDAFFNLAYRRFCEGLGGYRELFLEFLEGSFGVGVGGVLRNNCDNQGFEWVCTGFDEAGQLKSIL